jgi:hypothetical protein
MKPRHLSEGKEIGPSSGGCLINRSLILPYKEVGGLDGRKFSLTF